MQGNSALQPKLRKSSKAQLSALERAHDDAIESLNDLREDLDRSSSRIQVQAETIEGLRGGKTHLETVHLPLHLETVHLPLHLETAH